ncbi:MAG: PEGA domain-containing protein [Candidatus Micrarchaeota archaeon]
MEHMAKTILILLIGLAFVAFLPGIAFGITPSPGTVGNGNDPIDQMPPAPTVIATGILDISSYPAGATVWYDNSLRRVRAGFTPLKIGMKPGVYKITVNATGYPEYSNYYEVRDGSSEFVFVDFPAMPLPTAIILPSPTHMPLTTEWECEYPEHWERIKCRINLPDGRKQEKLPYIPEECRESENSTQSDCISTYNKLNACNAASNFVSREECAHKVLGIGNISGEKLKCNKMKEGNEKLACYQDLRRRTYALIKFRINSLSLQAERLSEMGVDEGNVIGLIGQIEEKIAQFNTAGGLENKKQVLWDVKKIWGDFKRDAVESLDAKAWPAQSKDGGMG